MIYNFIMLNHWQAVMTEKFNILIEVLVAIKYFEFLFSNKMVSFKSWWDLLKSHGKS